MFDVQDEGHRLDVLMMARAPRTPRGNALPCDTRVHQQTHDGANAGAHTSGGLHNSRCSALWLLHMTHVYTSAVITAVAAATAAAAAAAAATATRFLMGNSSQNQNQPGVTFMLSRTRILHFLLVYYYTFWILDLHRHHAGESAHHAHALPGTWYALLVRYAYAQQAAVVAVVAHAR